MKIDILTLFPGMIEGVLGESIIGRGREFGLIDIKAHNIRDYTLDKHRRTDDYPYGGGMGMVMQCDPLYRAWEEVREGEKVHTILMSPQGAPFCQEKAKELLARDRFILVCGHYEGIDQRFIDECVDEEISLGDLFSPAVRLPPWPLPMRCAAWCLACWPMTRVLPMKAISPVCWNIPSTPGRKNGMAVGCPMCSFPAITKTSVSGAGSSLFSAPGSGGPTSSRSFN